MPPKKIPALSAESIRQAQRKGAASKKARPDRFRVALPHGPALTDSAVCTSGKSTSAAPVAGAPPSPTSSTSRSRRRRRRPSAFHGATFRGPVQFRPLAPRCKSCPWPRAPSRTALQRPRPPTLLRRPRRGCSLARPCDAHRAKRPCPPAAARPRCGRRRGRPRWWRRWKRRARRGHRRRGRGGSSDSCRGR